MLVPTTRPTRRCILGVLVLLRTVCERNRNVIKYKSSPPPPPPPPSPLPLPHWQTRSTREGQRNLNKKIYSHPLTNIRDLHVWDKEILTRKSASLFLLLSSRLMTWNAGSLITWILHRAGTPASCLRASCSTTSIFSCGRVCVACGAHQSIDFFFFLITDVGFCWLVA